jgi:hypothetical protein
MNDTDMGQLLSGIKSSEQGKELDGQSHSQIKATDMRAPPSGLQSSEQGNTRRGQSTSQMNATSMLEHLLLNGRVLPEGKEMQVSRLPR